MQPLHSHKRRWWDTVNNLTCGLCGFNVDVWQSCYRQEAVEDAVSSMCG